MKFFYSRLSHCQLHNVLLSNSDLRNAISYLVSYKKHENLKVRANKNSIEIVNGEISIFIILYVGFEKQEFMKSKNKDNQHYITFDFSIIGMNEFKDIEIKVIDKIAIFFIALSFSKDEKLIDLRTFLNFDNN